MKCGSASCKQSRASTRPFIFVQDGVNSSSSQVFAIDDALLTEGKTSIQK